MPDLDWTGREHVLDLAARAPRRGLRRVPGKSLPGDSGNLIVHGDNLLALGALLPSLRGGVKLVFIDPPYNADDEIWSYEDRLYDPPLQGWFGEVVSGDPLRHDKWLCMMYPRLVLLRELLGPEGRIFVTIGDNEMPRLRLLMDEIFGARNLLGCAVWHKGPPRNHEDGFVAKTHNYVVIYAKDAVRASANPEPFTTWWTAREFGDSESARRELGSLFPDSPFPIPKPTRLVRRILRSATGPRARDVVLDCFAGSGTTAHAVLQQNAQDGGDRRFVLVEMADRAASLAAERTLRVIRAGSAPPSTGFDYCELDEAPRA